MHKYNRIINTMIFTIVLTLLFLLPGDSFSSFSEVLASNFSTSPDEILLVFESSIPEESYLSFLSEAYPMLSVNETMGNCILCSVDNHFSVDSLLIRLQSDPSIRIAEPNYPLQVLEEKSELPLPNDPFFLTQWSLHNTGSYAHYYGSLAVDHASTENIDTNIIEAWRDYPLSPEETVPVIVAIIDTGIDYRHPELSNHMWINPGEIPGNGIDDDGNGYIDDIYGWDFYHGDASVCHYTELGDSYTFVVEDNDNHGTHCAGIIAAEQNNNIGIAGVASNINVQIMALKVHGGPHSSGSVANAIKAIKYAEQMGARICNMSWGTENYSQALELCIAESKMLFVTAAGNNGANNNSTPVYPASFFLPNIISVAYIDPYGNLSSGSNFGLSTVDIAAPGQDIYSTTVGGYGYLSGSSMAAPHVSGIAAMLYAYGDNLFPAQVKELIINTMTPLSSLENKLIYPGIPNAQLAVTSLPLLQPDYEPPILDFSIDYEQEMISVYIDSFDIGGSGVYIKKYVYGSKDTEYFHSDSRWTIVTGDKLLLNKSGYYTFYVEDYAGNSSVSHLLIMDDTTAPSLDVDYTVSWDYNTFFLAINASDGESGIKSVKYALGEYSTKYFLNSGIDLELKNGAVFLPVASSAQVITIYVLDYRGNSTCKTIYPRIVPSTHIHTNVYERTLYVSDTYELKTTLFPFNTTDTVLYFSYAPNLLRINEAGVITALGCGDVAVEIITSSGVRSNCYFHIIAPEPPADADPPVTDEDSFLIEAEPSATGKSSDEENSSDADNSTVDESSSSVAGTDSETSGEDISSSGTP